MLPFCALVFLTDNPVVIGSRVTNADEYRLFRMAKIECLTGSPKSTFAPDTCAQDVKHCSYLVYATSDFLRADNKSSWSCWEDEFYKKGAPDLPGCGKQLFLLPFFAVVFPLTSILVFCHRGI
jgi:hypothetical protein